MDVREPALPVDPRLPGEPTILEVGRTRAWLARRGVRVWLPTRLLALRVGGRGIGTGGIPGYVIAVAVAWWAFGALFNAFELPGKVAYGAVLFALFQRLRRRRAQTRERLAERLAGDGAPPPFRVAARQVGWWYLVSAAVTFVGGAVLCAGSFLTTPQYTWKHWYPRAAELGLTPSRRPPGPGRPRWCSARRSAGR